MSGWPLVVSRLSHPGALFVSVVLALSLGLLAPGWALGLAPLGDTYLALFQMVLLPFLLSAMLCSVARLIRTPSAKAYIRGLLTVYPAGLLLAAAIGAFWAWLLAPGELANSGAGNALGQIIDATQTSFSTDLEIALALPADGAAAAKLGWSGLIPANIFAALTSGDTLKVLVFGVLFGLAMGRSLSGRAELLTMLEGVYATCQTFVRWLTMLLPLGLFAMLSAQVAKSGVAPLVAMGSFVLTQTVAGLTLIVLALLVVAWKTRTRLFPVLRALGPTIMLALATRSSMACIPTAIEALVSRLHLPRLGMELLMPLGTTVFRFGPALYFAIGAFFVAQLYGRPLELTDIALIIGLSAFAAVASSGATGPLSLAMISLVCVPLRIPFEAALVLFIAVDALLDPVRTLGIVVGNCAACAWLDGPRPHTGEPGGAAAEDPKTAGSSP